MRMKNAGANMPEVQSETIEGQAIAAARAGKALADACPYPFGTEAGQHFAAVWFLHTGPEASVNTRPPAQVQRLAADDTEGGEA